MSERNDRDSQSGQDDDQAALDRALQRGTDDLAGDIESNRNLSGSTTYETLREQGDLEVKDVDPGPDGGATSGGSR